MRGSDFIVPTLVGLVGLIATPGLALPSQRVIDDNDTVVLRGNVVAGPVTLHDFRRQPMLEDRLLLDGGPVWRNLGPGGGGWIESITASAYDANEVFAGSDVGGFYQSQDAGGSYAIHNDGLQDVWVERIVQHPVNPDILYVGTEGGVYRSNDHGRSWQLARNGFPAIQQYSFSAQIGALVIDPTAPNTLYAGIGNPRYQNAGQGAVYKTTDGAANWTKINAAGTLPSDAYVNDLVIDPANPQHLLLTCQYGVYQSSDGGVSWQQTNTGLPQPNARRLAVSAAQPQVVYVTLYSPPSQSPWQGGIYRSDDGGSTWTPRVNGLDKSVGKPGDAAEITSNYDYLAVSPTDPDILYAANTSWVAPGIWRTTNGGASWSSTIAPAFDRGWINFWGPSATSLSMSPLDPQRLYFGTSGQIYRTDDGGNTWLPVYSRTNPDGTVTGTGLEVTALQSIFVHPTDPNRLLFGYYDIGLLISADGGRSFRRSVSGIPTSNNNSFFWALFDRGNADHLWGTFGQWDTNQGVLAQSSDGGQNWTTITTNLPAARIRELIFDASSPGRVLARLDLKGVYACDDILNAPGTWYAVNTGLPYLDIRDLEASPSQPGTFWAALGSTTQLGGVFYSTDGGRNWQQVGATSLQVADIQSLVVAPSNPSRLYLATRDTWIAPNMHYGGVFRSDDSGQTWQRLLTDTYPQPVAVDPQDSNIVYVGLKDDPFHDLCAGRGIRRTLNGGATWQSMNGAGLSRLNVTQILIDPHDRNRLYLGTGGNGVFVSAWARLRRRLQHQRR